MRYTSGSSREKITTLKNGVPTSPKLNDSLVGLTGGYSTTKGNQGLDDYVDQLIREFHTKTLVDNEEIWIYDKEKGVFVPGAEPVIKARKNVIIEAKSKITT